MQISTNHRVIHVSRNGLCAAPAPRCNDRSVISRFRDETYYSRSMAKAKPVDKELIMRRISLLLGCVSVVASLSCAPDGGADPAGLEDATAVVPVFVKGGHPAHGAENFNAPSLHGRNEVPPNDSKGAGTAWFRLSDDGLSMDYKLIVANIDGVTQSHIHAPAPAGENVAPGVFLFGPVAAGVTVNGVLAEGTFTAANFIGPLVGMTMADLVEMMEDGLAYVNVHTIALPPGEIRDQIR